MACSLAKPNLQRMKQYRQFDDNAASKTRFARAPAVPSSIRPSPPPRCQPLSSPLRSTHGPTTQSPMTLEIFTESTAPPEHEDVPDSDGTIAGYDPYHFGHPHIPQPDSNLSDCFWHQLPWWAARDGNRLWYYPQLAAFFDHRLYLASNRGQQVLVSYSRQFSSRSLRCNYPPSKRRYKEMVGVYVGDTFIEQIPLSLLKRFSKTARNTFSNPVSARASSFDSAIELDFDDLVDGAFEESPRSPTNACSIAVPASLRSQTHMQCNVAASNGSINTGLKQLILDLDVDDSQSCVAVRHAIKWMRDHENCKGSDELLDYGPEVLDALPLDQLVAVYKAGLVFDLQPPRARKRVKDEILCRLSNSHPTIDTFKMLCKHIPVADSVFARAINSVHEHWEQRKYPEDEWKTLQHFFEFGDDVELGERFRRLSRKWQASVEERGVGKCSDGEQEANQDVRPHSSSPKNMSEHENQGPKRRRWRRRRIPASEVGTD